MGRPYAQQPPVNRSGIKYRSVPARFRLPGNNPVVWLLALPPVLSVTFFFVVPYGASLSRAFVAGGQITIRENAVLLHVTLFTLKQAFFSVLVSFALGLPGAWFIGRGPSRFTPLLRALTAIPFAMPSILVVLGFVLFYGNSGWVNRLFMAITGSSVGPFRILYKPEAIILAHGFFNFPLVIRLVGDGLVRVRKAYAPAAASLGASPLITTLTVILPLAFPSLMAAGLLVFLYSFTSFAVVLVLGGGPASTTLAVEIYRHARIFLNYHNAAALALLETLIAVSVFLAYIFFGKKSRETRTDIRERAMEGKNQSLYLRILMVVYGLLAAVFILGPLVSIVLESLLYRPSHAAAQVLSTRWWRTLGDTCLPAFLRSLALALSSATLACILALLAAGSVKINEERYRRNSPGTNLVRFFAAAPIVSSGIVLGLGWLIMYGRSFSRAPIALALLHAVIALPFAFNFISEGFRSLPANAFNASAVSGAGPVLGICTVAIPLSIKQIRSAWGFAAALSLGELNAVMMLGVENWETLPLYIYRAVGAYRFGTACAAGTLLILGCTACFLLAESGRVKYGA
jgi:thiamine transport system permease protein